MKKKILVLLIGICMFIGMSDVLAAGTRSCDFYNDSTGAEVEVVFSYDGVANSALTNFKIKSCTLASISASSRTGIETSNCESYTIDYNGYSFLQDGKVLCPESIDISTTTKKITIKDDGTGAYINPEGEAYEKILEKFNGKTISNTTGCYGLNKSDCTDVDQNGGYSCVWVGVDEGDENRQLYLNRGVTTSYCNTNDLIYVSCGSIKDIPRQVPKVFSVVLLVFYLGVPVILIISSIITLVGAISAGTEDGISKAKSKLFKKMIAAILTFLVVSIVKFAISLVPVEEGGVESSTLSECLNCFLNNTCSNSYIKTEINGEWTSTNLSEVSSSTPEETEDEDDDETVTDDTVTIKDIQQSIKESKEETTTDDSNKSTLLDKVKNAGSSLISGGKNLLSKAASGIKSIFSGGSSSNTTDGEGTHSGGGGNSF